MNSYPTGGEPARTDPVRTDPGRTDPGRTDPGRTDPVRTDPVRLTGCTLALPGVGEILSGLDLELEAGRVTWLVGESGAGKSTLCNLLAGLTPAEARVHGELEIGAVGGAGARAAGRSSENDRRSIDLASSRGRRALTRLRGRGAVAWAPQNAMDTFPPRLRLREWCRRADVEIPDLGAFGLKEAMLDQLPHELSGGQVSRISLAAAMARKPLLLVCDEPTAGLDPDQADAVVRVLNEHVATGHGAALAVTHDLSGMQRNAEPDDRVAVIFSGHIVENCSVAEFLAGGAINPYARALAAAAPAAGAHPLPLAIRDRQDAGQDHTEGEAPAAGDMLVPRGGRGPLVGAYREGDELRRLGLEGRDDHGAR